MDKKYKLTLHDVEQEFLLFAHYMSKIEDDYHGGTIDAAERAELLAAYAKKQAARVFEPEKAEFPSANWELL